MMSNWMNPMLQFDDKQFEWTFHLKGRLMVDYIISNLAKRDTFWTQSKDAVGWLSIPPRAQTSTSWRPLQWSILMSNPMKKVKREQMKLRETILRRHPNWWWLYEREVFYDAKEVERALWCSVCIKTTRCGKIAIVLWMLHKCPPQCISNVWPVNILNDLICILH